MLLSKDEINTGSQEHYTFNEINCNLAELIECDRPD